MVKMYLNFLFFKFSKKKYIAAISGGPDSMAMLNMFKHKISSVAFVNYNKREDTWYEEKIVKEFCEDNNIDFFLYSVNWENETKYNDNNFQSLARKIRYNFFHEISQKINNNNLLVAHNFNDFLETAYSQFKKKSSSLYYGILQTSSYKELKIFRPLLFIKKNNLEKYCQKNNVKYNIDYTNLNDDYERNRNRKIILKMSTTEYKGFIKKIFKYNSKNKKKLKKVNKFFLKWKNSNYNVNLFENISDDLKVHIIYLFLINNSLGKVSSDKIKSILDFVSKKSNKKYRVSSNINIYIKNENLVFRG